MEIREYNFKKIDNDKVISLLQGKLNLNRIEGNFNLNRDQVYLEISKAVLKNVIKLFKNDKDLRFDYIKCITGIDYKDYLEVIYSLYSFDNNYSVNIKVKIEPVNPEVESITDIFRSADWFEREIWEFFGINFKGHPNLKTLLLPGDVDYHPLLKSFEIKWEEREYKRPEVFD
ncbi:MAG: NADH-quinone oxidoreductase subunit C [Actinobacteria bacterium]|nr:NADH-quinone oxidoreductase subunit C [Actinomycetota bacterium]